MIRKPWYCPRALDWQTPTECLENHSQSTKEPARKGNADTRRHTHRQLARNEAQPAACHENQATPTGPPSQPPQYLTTMRSTTGSTTATATATAMTVAKTRNMGDYPHHTAATPFENIQFIPYRSRSRLPSMVLLSVVIVDALWFGGAGVCCASAFSVAPTAYRAVGGVPLRAILLRKEEAFVDGGEWESVDPILSQDADLGYVTAVIGQNEETNERFVAVESVSGKDGLQIGEDCVVFQDSIATIPINNPKLTDDRAIATLLSTLSVHRTLSLLRKTKDKPESTKVNYASTTILCLGCSRSGGPHSSFRKALQCVCFDRTFVLVGKEGHNTLGRPVPLATPSVQTRAVLTFPLRSRFFVVVVVVVSHVSATERLLWWEMEIMACSWRGT